MMVFFFVVKLMFFFLFVAQQTGPALHKRVSIDILKQNIKKFRNKAVKCFKYPNIFDQTNFS